MYPITAKRPVMVTHPYSHLTSPDSSHETRIDLFDRLFRPGPPDRFLRPVHRRRRQILTSDFVVCLVRDSEHVLAFEVSEPGRTLHRRRSIAQRTLEPRTASRDEPPAEIVEAIIRRPAIGDVGNGPQIPAITLRHARVELVAELDDRWCR